MCAFGCFKAIAGSPFLPWSACRCWSSLGGALLPLWPVPSAPASPAASGCAGKGDEEEMKNGTDRGRAVITGHAPGYGEQRSYADGPAACTGLTVSRPHRG